MSRSNYDKPFYVDIGTSIVAIRCASNHDVIEKYDYVWEPLTLKIAHEICERMNREVEISRPPRNCDVGTIEEQAKRFNDFCITQRCTNCPFFTVGGVIGECGIRWSQLPYGSEANR